MELTEKNGHASIEEILASVRRIIAEEPGSNSPLIDLHTPVNHPRGDGLLEDPSDFDLPSMFKTPAPAAASDKPAPLFGRLSEAIRAASNGNTYNGEAARTDQSLSALKLHRLEAAENGSAPHFLLSTFHETTAPRVDELAAASVVEQPAAPAPFAANGTHIATAAPADDPRPAPETFATADRTEPQQPSATPSPQIPRQMAAFKDTRFRSMGSPPANDAPPAFVSPFEASATAALVSAADHAATVAPAIAFEAPATAIPAVVEIVPAPEPSTGLAAQIAASYPALAAEPPASEPVVPVPPPVPAVTAAPAEPAPAQAAAPIEDSTADLLRPMLRQWLAENMPRMVEKALHIEVAETVKSTKK